jgi:hypothetical protein
MYASPHFTPIPITGRNLPADKIKESGCRENTASHAKDLPLGKQTYWGIPFDCGGEFVYVNGGSHSVTFSPVTARYLVFLHASETPEPVHNKDGLVTNFRGNPQLMEPICDYVMRYADGSAETVTIRSRMEINDMNTGWGSGGFLSLAHKRGKAMHTATDDIVAGRKPEWTWGSSQSRVSAEGSWPLSQWLYAFENPHPEKEITGIDIIKKNGNVFLFGVTAAGVAAHPLRYSSRKKALFKLNGDASDPLKLIDIDLGHIISVVPRPVYDNAGWEKSALDVMPEETTGQYIVEFDSHEDAIFYLGEERTPLPLKDAVGNPEIHINPAEQPVTLRVCDATGKPVPVKVHAHGAAGEYLPPRNRHRIPNPYWFEDFSVDYVRGRHWATYIDGTAEYYLPQGEVFFEISKGFEIKPVRTRFVITPDTKELTVTLERVVDWRTKGWVTADTHVHFLSPQTALLEGEAEGVNVVNLLASQWGELFTNLGDFTGSDTPEASNKEYMVKVGTENRQHIMGHISLLGYEGKMILPVTTDGPSESAQGDPMEMTLTQWAAQCRAQRGLNILPHFPNPRAEAAAAIVSDLIDGVEVCPGWNGPNGINPYYLSDWYRYLNCGYQVAAVGGTDKMYAGTAIGEMRTYAKINGPLTYQIWKEAVIAGRTFATSGALVDMRVEGKDLGSTIRLSGKANLTIEWDVASVVIPITTVELVKNGETVDSVRLDGMLGERGGYFTVNTQDSAWFALRVRGRVGESVEIITAHTSAVFVYIGNKPVFNGPDAATILDQIEGVTAYVKTLATKAQESQFKLALGALMGAHRALHNKMHAEGHFHGHSPEDMHAGH